MWYPLDYRNIVPFMGSIEYFLELSLIFRRRAATDTRQSQRNAGIVGPNALKA